MVTSTFLKKGFQVHSQKNLQKNIFIDYILHNFLLVFDGQFKRYLNNMRYKIIS
jgi:hypothetical protein